MSKAQITYHLRSTPGVAVCGTAARWPDRAVVHRDLFRVQEKKYGTVCCTQCRRIFLDDEPTK